MRLLYQQLAQREQQMRLAEQQQAKVHRLEALATLAAGAAHELATPLSTIAVVAKEMSRNVNRWNAPDSLRQDLTLIQEELKYCRSVLDRMRAGAGEAAAERIADITAEQVIAEVLVGLRDAQRVVVERNALPTTSLRLPLQAVAQALRNLVQNAIDATPTEQSVVLSIQQVNQGDWDIRVEDRGDGMSESILKRIGEPFFTTKEPGKGMGLGVYLSHNVLSGLGGNLEFESRPGQGTVASIRLPKSVSNSPVG
jgi:two-component system sensor histidine kinase RegB